MLKENKQLGNGIKYVWNSEGKKFYLCEKKSVYRYALVGCSNLSEIRRFEKYSRNKKLMEAFYGNWNRDVYEDEYTFETNYTVRKTVEF